MGESKRRTDKMNKLKKIKVRSSLKLSFLRIKLIYYLNGQQMRLGQV